MVMTRNLLTLLFFFGLFRNFRYIFKNNFMVFTLSLNHFLVLNYSLLEIYTISSGNIISFQTTQAIVLMSKRWEEVCKAKIAWWEKISGFLITVHSHLYPSLEHFWGYFRSSFFTLNFIISILVYWMCWCRKIEFIWCLNFCLWI